MNRRVLIAGAAAVAALTGGTGAALAFGGGDETGNGRRQGPPATTEITREDLVDARTVEGRVDFAGRRPVLSGGSGTVTRAPAAGRTVTRGGLLYGLNARPVTLLYGSMPAFRTMKDGTVGPDVRQLEANLSALGYGGSLRVDDRFDKATETAVKAWRRNRLGVERPDGQVTQGDVVFLTGAARVADVKVALGDPVEPGKQVLTLSGGRRIVRAELEAADERLARKGAAVEVEIGGGDSVRGRISRVAKPAPQSGGSGDETIKIEVSLPRSAGLGQGGTAQVKLVDEERSGVLAVPVEALVALREGGHGLQLVENGRVRTVKVATGMYADGKVEVSGEGLREGMKVGTVSE